MAVTINTAVDSNYFTINGIRHARIYQPLLGQIATEVGIFNAFDTRQQLLSSTPFVEYTVDGFTFASADLLIIALLPVIYKYQGTGAVTGAPDWGDISGVLANQTDLQNELNNKSNVGHVHSFASLSSKPTSIAGFGITDSYTDIEVDGLLSNKADNVHPHIDKADIIAYNSSGTGLHEGGVISVNASTTTYDVSAGTGVIVDNISNPDEPTLTHISWSAKINVAPVNILTQLVTYISIDINGNISETSARPTPTQRRSKIFIGVVVHSNNVNVNAVNQQPVVAIDLGAQVQDILEYIGFKSRSGNVVTNAGTDLTIKKAAGTAFRAGSNFHNLYTQPHEFLLPVLDPITFRYRTQTGSEGLNVTVVSPDFWDNNGVSTAIGGSPNQATIQRVFVFPSNVIRIQLGQEIFPNFSTAVAEAGTEQFILENNISENGLFLGSIVIKSNATDLSNPAQVLFITPTGEVSFSSISETMQSAYNVSTVPQVTTNVTNGEMIIQRGSALDSDIVFGIRNGASTTKFSVSGDGDVEALSLSFDTATPVNVVEGQIAWNAEEETLDIGLSGAVLQAGQETHYHSRNNSGVNIKNGNGVMGTGTLGASGRITIAKMNNDGSVAPLLFLGLATEDIVDGVDGKVTNFGKIRDLQTDGVNFGETWLDGDLIYLSTSVAGNLTNIEPDAPYHRAPVATVINAHGTNGILFVRATINQGINHARDVQITSLSDADFLKWDLSNERWENSQLTLSDISEVTATFGELNLLDLSGLTTGWVLSADTATTASWKAPSGGGGTWGSITGTLSAQTDLQAALDLKLNSSLYTAADVLTKIKTVDGSGSGLDADLLRNLAPSTSATVNTIAQRDSVGDLYVTDMRFDKLLVGGANGGGNPVKISGSGTGNANVNFWAFFENNGTTRQAYIGFASGTNSDLYFFNDTSGKSLRLKGNGLMEYSSNGKFLGTCTATNFILSSDKRLKENIRSADNLVVNVDWKQFNLIGDKEERYGVVAQELEIKHPEFVRTDDDGLKSVAYIDLLIAKIVELEARLKKAGI